MTNLNPVDNYLHGSWEALGNGAPTLVALAQLCSERWVRGASAAGLDELELPPESLTILFAARERAIIELRAVNSAFDTAARLLAVYVEMSEERTIAFRDQERPENTLRFLEGFRVLCDRGLIIHHIHRDFSLAPQAIDLAQDIEQAEVQTWLDMATEFGLHD